jgi:epoxyqueuosine reductase
MVGYNVNMSLSTTTELIYTGLERKGYKGRIVSIRYLADLKEEIEARYKEGIFDEVFYRERLCHFKYSIPGSILSAKSVIIVSAPQLQVRTTFNFEGRSHHFIVPPTYSRKTDKMVENLLSDIIGREGFSLHQAILPLKLLAGYSGLAQYGKNNIAYVEGMGSFHRLCAFYSDLPVIEDSWSGLELLEQCNNCRACINKCPTHAIVTDQFLIKAERCLTFHNERPNEFPDWIEPSWHNCFIGCMYCQSVCPANKKFKDWVESEETFTEKETGLILSGGYGDKLPQTAVNKLKRLYLFEDSELLPRNLDVLIGQQIT